MKGLAEVLIMAIPSTKKGLFLLTQDGCPYCQEEINLLATSPLKDKVTVLDVSKEKVQANPVVQQVIEGFNLTGVPQMVVLEGDKACLMERDMNGHYKKKGRCVILKKD